LFSFIAWLLFVLLVLEFAAILLHHAVGRQLKFHAEAGDARTRTPDARAPPNRPS